MLAHSEEEPSLEEGRSLAFKLQTTPGTDLCGSVKYLILFYIRVQVMPQSRGGARPGSGMRTGARPGTGAATHFTRTSPALHLHFTRTSPALDLHFTRTSPALHPHLTCTSPALHPHFTRTSPALHLHFTRT
jgi:hypothetical protein